MQKQLQRARALTTELRNILEELPPNDPAVDFLADVELLENYLDEHPDIGNGFQSFRWL